ncbi:MAG: hypothetical protein LBL36_00185 [Clostridiales Family XIII bacterium]|nr:hypothetical protein [Clostridiales Family XIII bacterium]
MNTRYTIHGNTIKQIVDFDEDTAFPVVADPELWDDVKCAAALVLCGIGATATAKLAVRLVKNAGSVAKAVKAMYKVIKMREFHETIKALVY